MGIPIEFNTVLALREYDARGNFPEDQCVPADDAIAHNSRYEFRKSGYRVLDITKPVPLVVTKGNQQFVRVVGLVKIGCICVDVSPTTGEPVTTGVYRFAKVFTPEESAAWLSFLNPEVEHVGW